MKPINTVAPEELDDEELVVRSHAGDVGAFRGIAARYYPLIHTLAYEATGSVSRSDDLARDTFIAAWRQLAELREPDKLRSWLCGIAHELIDDFLRHRAASPGAVSCPRAASDGFNRLASAVCRH